MRVTRLITCSQTAIVNLTLIHGCFALYKWQKLSLEWTLGMRKIGFLEGKTLMIYLAFFFSDTSRSDSLLDKEV